MKSSLGALGALLMVGVLAVSCSSSKARVSEDKLISSECRSALNSRLTSCGFRIQRLDDTGEELKIDVATRIKEGLAVDSAYYYRAAELACENVACYLRGTEYANRQIYLTLNAKLGDSGQMVKRGLASYDPRTQQLKWEPTSAGS